MAIWPEEWDKAARGIWTFDTPNYHLWDGSVGQDRWDHAQGALNYVTAGFVLDISTLWVRNPSTGELVIDFDRIYKRIKDSGYMHEHNVRDSYEFVRNFERHECHGFSILDTITAMSPNDDPIKQLTRAYSFALALAFRELVPKPKSF